MAHHGTSADPIQRPSTASDLKLTHYRNTAMGVAVEARAASRATRARRSVIVAAAG